MSNKPFIYQAPFPMGKDNTEYYLLTSDYVSVTDFDGETILKVEPEALTLLAQQAFHDASFMLRPAHQKQVAAILHDPCLLYTSPSLRDSTSIRMPSSA